VKAVATRKQTGPRNAKSKRPPVRFELAGVTAGTVTLAGTFNGWDVNATPLKEQFPGHWVVELPLAPGVYEYLLVVDGAWRMDPQAVETAPNPFGGLNAVRRLA